MAPTEQNKKPAQDKSQDQKKGLANEDQPSWAPPESQPEPRPADPILKPSSPTRPNANSPT